MTNKNIMVTVTRCYSTGSLYSKSNLLPSWKLQGPTTWIIFITSVVRCWLFCTTQTLDIFWQHGKVIMDVCIHYLVTYFWFLKGNRGFAMHTFHFPEMMIMLLDPLCLCWNDPRFFCFIFASSKGFLLAYSVAGVRLVFQSFSHVYLVLEHS